MAYIVNTHAPVIATLADNTFDKQVAQNSKVYFKYCSAFEVFVRGDEEPHIPEGITTEVMNAMAKK